MSSGVWSLPLLVLSAASAARAQAPAAEPDPAPTTVNAVEVKGRHDAALERVLRSGCRDGLSDVRALAADPDVPWAPTVARLCDDILRQGSAGPPAVAATIDETASANEGRGRLVLWSSLYGIWLGIATDVLADVNGTRSAIVPPMIGLAATLGVSLLITADHPVTTGQAWTIISGLDYASVDGALWGAGMGLSAKGVVGSAIATSAVATGAAVWVAATQRPKAGDIELVRSSMLWGTTAGLLGLAAAAPSNTSSRTAWLGGAIAMDVSLALGVGLANQFDLSRNRVLIIDAGAIGGGLVGFGTSWLIVGGANANGRAVAGGALAGLLAGISIAAIATRQLDHGDGEARAPGYPALVGRGVDGRWSFNVPSPTTVMNATGARPAGATLAAIGGLF